MSIIDAMGGFGVHQFLSLSPLALDDYLNQTPSLRWQMRCN